MTKNRTLASIISNDTSKIKTVYTDSDSIVTSASLGVTAAVGTTTYLSADTLPASADNGDQALVTSTNRLYIFTNGGWYNIALINTAPYWSSEASSSYDLNTDGTSTTITLLAVDSEGIPITYTAITDSDFDGIATITKDSDNGRTFIITPTDSENGTAIAGTGTVTFRASDGVNLVSTLSTFTLSFITTVANSAETTLLLKADTTGTDNQVDASSSSHTITETGNVTSTVFTPYHPGGYSTYFDGTGDYLSISGPATGVGTWTLEGWFYFNTLVSNRALFSQGTADDTGGFIVWSDSNGTITFYSNGVILQTSGAVNVNEWAHIAIVSNSNSTTIFVNGVSVGTGSYSGSGAYYPKTFNNSPFQINRGYGGITEGNNCYIADVRLVNNTAVYTSNFTPPTERLTAIANTSLLTCHLPYIADGSTNGHAITIVGNTSTNRLGPHDYEPYTKADHGGSLYFDGADDYLVIPHSTNLDLNGVDWTIEFWYWWDGGQTSYQGIIGKRANNAGWTLALDNGTTSSGKKLFWYNNGNNAEATPSIFPNKWYHIAFVRQSGVIKGYNNGVEKLSVTDDAYSSTYTTTIGVSQGAGSMGETISGYLSDFRIVKGTAVYTSNFTPPTAPLTAITNTSLLTCTNKNDIWDASTGNLLTKTGNVTSSSTQRKFISSSAVYFDGTGDYIGIDTLNFGRLAANEPFTVEGWFRFSAISPAQPLFHFTDSIGTLNDVLYTSGNTPPNLTFYGNGSDITANSGGGISLNTWYHIAMTRHTDNRIRVFIDGTLKNTSGGTYADLVPRYLEIGRYATTNYLNGYAQSIRITKGLARYTATFTPPTAEFDG